MKFPLEEIADFDFNEQDWRVTQEERDPQEVDL
jgi:hypothetical protein